MSKESVLVPVEDHAEVRRAIEAMTPMRERLLTLERQEAAYVSVTDPRVERANTPSEEQVLEAHANLPAIREERARLALEVHRLQREVDAARDRAQSAIRAEFHRQERAAIGAVSERAEALRQAVDRLNRIETHKHDLLGSQPERFGAAFNCVASPTPTFTPLLDHWRETARSYGLLD